MRRDVDIGRGEITLALIMCTTVAFMNMTSSVARDSSNVVHEGHGCGQLVLGMPPQEVQSLLGRPDGENRNGNKLWLSYRDRYGVDVLFVGGEAHEIRFNEGFQGHLSRGPGIGAPLQRVLQTYGRPRRVMRTEEKKNTYKSRVLYKLPDASKIMYPRSGVLFWFDERQRVQQFVIFRSKRHAKEGGQKKRPLPKKRRQKTQSKDWQGNVSKKKNIPGHEREQSSEIQTEQGLLRSDNLRKACYQALMRKAKQTIQKARLLGEQQLWRKARKLGKSAAGLEYGDSSRARRIVYKANDHIWPKDFDCELRLTVKIIKNGKSGGVKTIGKTPSEEPLHIPKCKRWFVKPHADVSWPALAIEMREKYIPGLDAPERTTNEHLELLQGVDYLRTLSLRRTNITDDGLRHLRGLENVRTLLLRNTEVSNKGLVHLKRLKTLQSLGLTNTAITDKGMRHLEGLKHLRELVLCHTRITDEGLSHLGKLQKLRKIDVSGTNVTRQGVEYLKNHIQNLKVIR